jgi:hypothetical protein
MRTTLRIDDDVLLAVQERARREKRSSGEVLSDLVREALIGRPAVIKAPISSRGFNPLPHRGPLVSNDLIDRLREDEGE